MTVSTDGGFTKTVALRSNSGEVSVDGVPEGRFNFTFSLEGSAQKIVVNDVTVIERGAGGGGLGY